MEFTVNLSWVLSNMANMEDEDIRDVCGQDGFEKVYEEVAGGKIKIEIEEWTGMKFLKIIVPDGDRGGVDE